MKQPGAKAPAILHLHSTFAAGGKELRCVQLINAFGKQAQHSIVSALPERMEAAKLISNSVSARYPQNFPSLQGLPTPGRLFRIAREMAAFDLVLTYNWGAMDAVMAHLLYSEYLGLPPLIHHEDGFNEDERVKLKPARNIFRRLALRTANRLVVPSEQLEEIALETWHQPMGRVTRISNGIDTRAFTKAPKSNAIPDIKKRDGEFWVGTLAGLRKVKNIPKLVRAFSALPETWKLVIVGDGPEKAAIEREAAKLGIGGRVFLPGFVAHPDRYVGLFDIFALSSDTEQFPISVVEAMAAARPIVAPAVGDVADMVSEENAPFIVAKSDDEGLADALRTVAQDIELATKIGAANQAKAQAEFDESTMIGSYSRLYWNAMGRQIPAAIRKNTAKMR